MRRKPILLILAGYCFLALALSFASIAVTPSAVLADGVTGPEPPLQSPAAAPADSTLRIVPVDLTSTDATVQDSGKKDFSFFESVEIIVRAIF